MSSMSDPSRDSVAVTPADGSDIRNGQITRGLYVGGAGNITVTMGNGNDVLFSNVPAGTVLPIRVTRVKSTGTTATLIIALF